MQSIGKSILVLLASAVLAPAQRGYPRIETVFPGAVATGSSTEVMLRGRYNLRESTRVSFDRPGVTAKVLEWMDLGELAVPAAKRKPFEAEGLRLKVDVAADATPGIYPFRILTKGSLSSSAHLLVVDGRCVNEVEPNNSDSEAQPVVPGTTLNGRLDEDADLDIYRFEAAAGENLAFLAYAARLQRPVPHLERDFSDLLLTLYDSSGRQLSTADDSLTEDPEFAYTFPTSGTYFLRLREARHHAGKDKWWYALSITRQPVIRSAFPPVVNAGATAPVLFSGFLLDTLKSGALSIPTGATGRYGTVMASNRVLFGISDVPTASEPRAAGAKPLSLPIGINGRIDQDGEVDRYRFTAKAGDRLEFDVQARRWGSLLDPLIEMRDTSGQLLEAQDDMVNTVGQTVDGLAFPVIKDPRMEWTAPWDGEFELHVRDANFFGGREHFYFLAARPQRPDFALVVDDDRMPVGPGESVTAVVTVERRNGFNGPIELSVRGLPAGVFAHPSTVPAHLTQANIVVTAIAEAKPYVRPIRIVGRAGDLERTATPFAPMGQAGGRSFLAVPSAYVGVTEASDIILDAEPKDVILEPGKSVRVRIRATRNQYSGPIEMNVILWNLMQRFSKLPAGVIYEEKQSKTSLAANETEGYVTLRADADAPKLKDYLMAVMGQITYNRIYMTRTAAPFRLTIR